MTSITVQLEDGELATFTKSAYGIILNDGEDMEVPIDWDRELEGEFIDHYHASIERDNTPEFAKFSTLWYSHFFDYITPFTAELHITFCPMVELFERLMFELWKDNSRILNGDQFIISHDDFRCTTLGTAVDFPNNVETTMSGLLSGRN